MRIFFDVDLTIVSSFLELRPHVKEVMAALREDGHEVYLWTSGGKVYAEYVVARCELGELVEGCFTKGDGMEITPDFCVDDLVEFVAAYGGYQVRPFVGFSRFDTEMLEVLQIIRDDARNNHIGPIVGDNHEELAIEPEEDRLF